MIGILLAAALRVTAPLLVAWFVTGLLHPGTFSDDPPQRGLLGTDVPAHVRTHTAMAQAVLTFLQEVLDRRSVTFDGPELAERYRDRGLRARFVRASTEQDKSGGRD